MRIQAKAKPLVEILAELHQAYEVQFSFDPAQVKNCSVTIKRQFPNLTAALAALGKPCNLKFEAVAGVFIVQEQATPLPTVDSVIPPLRSFYGQLLDQQSQEPLAYALLQIGRSQLFTDEHGYFSHQSRQTILRLQASHLGYRQLDTLIKHQENAYQLYLKPHRQELTEITVQAPRPVLPSLIAPSQRAGLFKINLLGTPFLAGHTTNSLLAFMRLQAGVTAAGEPVKTYLLWGSYKGQTELLFDQITLFSPTTIYDQLSTINPMFSKNVELSKGGQQVTLGDRVGAVIQITSPQGHADSNFTSLALTPIEFNSDLINAYFNIPLSKQSALQLGTRAIIPGILQVIVGSIVPDLTPFVYFGDITAKYSKTFKEQAYFQATVLGRFNQSSIMLPWRNDPQQTVATSTYTAQERQGFWGLSLLYQAPWRSWGRSKWQASYSQSISYLFSEAPPDLDTLLNPVPLFNEIAAYQWGGEHYFPSTSWHQLSIGTYALYNHAKTIYDYFPQLGRQRLFRWRFFMRAQLFLAPNLVLDLGMRADFPLGAAPVSQPRIQLLWTPHQRWQFQAAYGLYHQFVNEHPIVDILGNVSYHWTINNGRTQAVVAAKQAVGSITTQQPFWSARVEAYHKQLNQLTQLMGDPFEQEIAPILGRAYSYGLNAQINAQIKRQQFWLAYAYSHTKEQFGNNPWQFAPQDQRHELKAATIFQIKRWDFSLSYVFGSGFSNPSATIPTPSSQAYHRLDLGIRYRLQTEEYRLEIGSSLLNVLNQQNVRYNGANGFNQNLTSNNVRGAQSFFISIFLQAHF